MLLLLLINQLIELSNPGQDWIENPVPMIEQLAVEIQKLDEI
jgi:hypothetical protein